MKAKSSLAGKGREATLTKRDMERAINLKYIEVDDEKSRPKALKLKAKADAMLATYEVFLKWHDWEIAAGRSDDVSYERFKKELVGARKEFEKDGTVPPWSTRRSEPDLSGFGENSGDVIFDSRDDFLTATRKLNALAAWRWK